MQGTSHTLILFIQYLIVVDVSLTIMSCTTCQWYMLLERVVMHLGLHVHIDKFSFYFILFYHNILWDLYIYM